MKKIFLSLLLIMSMITSICYAQSNTYDDMYQITKSKANEQLINGLKARQKALRNVQRALQNRIDSVLWDEALTAVKDTAFTLEADKVVFKYGQIAYVNSNTNFVSVNKGTMRSCKWLSMCLLLDLMELVELRCKAV